MTYINKKVCLLLAMLFVMLVSVEHAYAQPSPPLPKPASNVTHNSFMARWLSVSGATAYFLDVSTDSDYSNVILTNASTTATSYDVVGLNPTTNYYYRVRVQVSGQTSTNSSSVLVTTLAGPPPVPFNLSATNPTANSFVANWAAVTGATGYRLDVSPDFNFTTFVGSYNNLSVTGTSYTVTGLSENREYYFRVRSANATTTSSNSVVMRVNLGPAFIKVTDILTSGITTTTQVDALTISQRAINKTFVDGLGRPIQSVSQQSSPGQLDVVTPVYYDGFGRESRKYLPFTSGYDGAFKTIAYDANTGNYTGTVAGNFYSNNASGKIAQDARPFAETVFEASPLNRKLKDYGTGSDWAASGTYNPDGKDKHVGYQYLINTFGTGVSVIQEKVIKWVVNASNMPVRATALSGYVETGGYYSTGQLSITVTIDEQGNVVREYTNTEGQMILKKVQVVANSVNLNSTSDWALTYYIYDDLGNLRIVLQPELSKKVHASADTYVVATADMVFAFTYKYDNRNRMIEKVVPGAGVVYMVYDSRDRLVFTQDANQRASSGKNWTFTKYDALNRPILTGIYTADSVLAQNKMQRRVNAYYGGLPVGGAFFETFSTTNPIHGYSNNSYPLESDISKYLTITYYDNYDFKSLWVNDNYDFVSDPLFQSAEDPNYNTQVLGLVTGVKTKVLDNGTAGAVWLKAISYFDKRLRLMQSISDNFKGGTDRVSNLYDFGGKLLETTSHHLERDIGWKNLVNMELLGNTLRRNTSASAGAVTSAVLPAGQDGWIEAVYSESTTTRYFGFNDVNTDVSYANINYCFQLATGGNVKVYENGQEKKALTGVAKFGDSFRIVRTGTSVKYYHNGVEIILTIASTPSTTSLTPDFLLANTNGTLAGMRSSLDNSNKTITRRFIYDHAGRMKETWHKIDNGSDVRLVYNDYNELGQLVDKKLHSITTGGADAKQSVDYRYNIRGWLTSINNSSLTNAGTNDDTGDYFGMELAYNNAFTGLTENAEYNGNISAIRWSHNQALGTTKQFGYTFSYDAMNRLLGASNKKSGDAITWSAGDYSEDGLQYDLNGNIKALNRQGKGGVTIDQLTYTYVSNFSNQLLSVTDNALAANKPQGFFDGSSSGSEYTYDGNGNMTRDINKGIAANGIAYNYLNLPEYIIKGGNTIRYIYDATGRKLAQQVTYGSGTNTRTDYAGEFIYENDVLQFINHEEGRVVVSGTKLVYTNSAESTSAFTASNATTSTVLVDGEDYVKVTSSGTVARTGVFPVGGVIPVAGGQRYKIRVKGYNEIASGTASPAYILVKADGNDLDWPGAKLPVKASTASPTEAWIEQIVTVPAAATTLQIGVVWNTVVAGENIYLNEVEVTRLDTKAPEYQYFMKDHLGNVRLTFTTVDEIDNGTATMETSNANAERGKFLYYDEAVIVDHTLFDHTNVGPTFYSTRLTGANTNAVYGLAKSLSVMPGDVINVEVYAKYLETNSGNRTAALNAFIAAINGASPPPGSIIDGGAAGSLGGGSYPFTPIDHSSEGGTAPKAYLNYIVFNRDFEPINNGFLRIGTAGLENGNDVNHFEMSFKGASAIKITEPGYVYIYLSNENPTPVEVYFDDFKVEHIKSPVIQTEDYYPFGLTFNSYSRENRISQDNKYNGKEEQDELNLEWLDYGARMYLNDIGRWMGADPMAEEMRRWSPYNYTFNNPLKFNDPDGMTPQGATGPCGDQPCPEEKKDASAKQQTPQTNEPFKGSGPDAGLDENGNPFAYIAHFTMDPNAGVHIEGTFVGVKGSGDAKLNSNGVTLEGEGSATTVNITLGGKIGSEKNNVVFGVSVDGPSADGNGAATLNTDGIKVGLGGTAQLSKQTGTVGFTVAGYQLKATATMLYGGVGGRGEVHSNSNGFGGKFVAAVVAGFGISFDFTNTN